MQNGGTYGLAAVVAHFDEPITDRAAAKRRLAVTTSPPATGSWYWRDDQNAHGGRRGASPQDRWSPRRPPSTAAPLGDGLYGQQDQRATLTVGDAHVAIADDRTKQVSVYTNGQLVRTMPTSMGMGGSETIGGQTISFWKQRGGGAPCWTRPTRW